MVIAIDGPAGTGKSTVAKRVAKELNIVFLNSGSFYRAITLALIQAGKLDGSVKLSKEEALAREEEILAFAEQQSLDYDDAIGHFILNGKDVEDLLHSDAVDGSVAAISSIVPVRHLANRRMRELTAKMSIVCEGRDMTTVVFPQAEYKFFLDASVDVQAQRRFDQGCSTLTLEQIKADIIRRDEIDRNKAEGALKVAEDAVYIDTSDLTIEEVCGIIINKIHL
ncbi:MAG: (d)CMP kinase [Treponemataceae bacterium]|nr:(d)CMP kinase [Treponemataceae bacterium]